MLARSTYDVNDSEEQDLTTVQGFFSLILKVLCLKEGSLLYAGHPCSLMVWMARSVHRRCFEQPWGDESWECSLPAILVHCVPVRMYQHVLLAEVFANEPDLYSLLYGIVPGHG